MSGKGIEFLNDNTCYIGDFREGMRQGWGKLYYPNGDFYEGQFKNGARHGLGKFYEQKGGSYDG